MKIYTRGGDDGTTGLFGGGRVPKDDPIFDLLGDLDELNSSLGFALAFVRSGGLAFAGEDRLIDLQRALFAIGAFVGGHRASAETLDILGLVKGLEADIDEADEQLEPLRQFILPGGTQLASSLHLARSICRRSERRMVKFGEYPESVHLLNRLSDWLFTQARLANHSQKVPDTLWKD